MLLKESKIGEQGYIGERGEIGDNSPIIDSLAKYVISILLLTQIP